MNEILPPSEPDKEPPKPNKKRPDFDYSRLIYQSDVPSKKVCAGLGFLIFIVSVALSFAFPPLCLFGLAAAIASLFFPGYRFIFVGYILTVGVLLLGVIIYCSNHPFEGV